MKTPDELDKMLDGVFNAKRLYEEAVLVRLAGTKPMAVLSDPDDEECEEPFTLNMDDGDCPVSYSVDMVKAENGMIICHVCSVDGKRRDEWYPYYFFGLDGLYLLSSIAWE